MDILELEAPIEGSLTEELIALWETTFQLPFGAERAPLQGAESEYNRNFVYVAHVDERLAGSCRLTVPRSRSNIGGLGEVAVVPEFRGRGIATALCRRAVGRFRELGGEALFLGTENPAARRVYHRLGWRQLAGATVMALVEGRSPEEFIARRFEDQQEAEGDVEIAAGTAADRIPMIPLLLAPHDDQVLDANLGLFSIRYATQNSCMGLYPRYFDLAKNDGGAGFSARVSGTLVGLSTVRIEAVDSAHVDALAEKHFPECWEHLIRAALSWGGRKGITTFVARVSVEDEGKLSRFESLGFRIAGDEEPFTIDSRQVSAVRLEHVAR